MSSEPKNLVEVLEAIENFQDSCGLSWYRGHSKPTYELVPKIARKPGGGAHSFVKVREAEILMHSEFGTRSRAYFSEVATDHWDVLFNMQHYGVPTRLLDWSESPFVALFFALKPRSGGYADDAIVWMVNPEKWNEAFFKFPTGVSPMMDKTSDTVRDYAVGLNQNRYREEPLMLLGSHNSPRIVAQRGGFTLFGKKFTSLDKVKGVNHKIDQSVLDKIVIKKDYCEDIFKSLVRKGFDETFVYPDIEGLAQEVSRKYEI